MTSLRLILAAVLVLSGCDSPPTYSIRGVVVRTKSPADGYGTLVLLHEAVAEFKNVDGVVVGMDAMAMSFRTAPELPLEDVAPGDKVLASFTVYWKREPRLLIRSLKKLEPETELALDGYSLEVS